MLRSRKPETFLSRSAVAQLGVILRDGSHVGHECARILARGVTFGAPASGIRRLGVQPKPAAVLRAANRSAKENTIALAHSSD